MVKKIVSHLIKFGVFNMRNTANKKYIASHINEDLHTKFKQLSQKEGISLCALLEKLVGQFVEGKILLADNKEIFAKSNVPEIQEIIEEKEVITEVENKDKELSLIEHIETNLLEIKTKLEDLENKVNNTSKLSSDEVKLELIKNLIFK